MPPALKWFVCLTAPKGSLTFSPLYKGKKAIIPPTQEWVKVLLGYTENLKNMQEKKKIEQRFSSMCLPTNSQQALLYNMAACNMRSSKANTLLRDMEKPAEHNWCTSYIRSQWTHPEESAIYPLPHTRGSHNWPVLLRLTGALPSLPPKEHKHDSMAVGSAGVTWSDLRTIKWTHFFFFFASPRSLWDVNVNHLLM